MMNLKDKGKLPPTKDRQKKGRTDIKVPRALGPLGYIIKDTLRNRSRTLLAMGGIASLTLLFVLFSSMDQGLDDFFSEETSGAPSDEQKELFKVKEVMDNWVYLITVLCWVLMVLVVANTSIITVMERKFELASLRALGISSSQVSLLVSGSIVIIVLGGVAMGLLFGIMFVPIIDRANIAFTEGGVGLPLSMDPMIALYSFGMGIVSAAIGLIPPLVMINKQSPLEVLRHA
ncbi:MAG: ABC transporter permease [Thermoplasmatota archaeon]